MSERSTVWHLEPYLEGPHTPYLRILVQVPSTIKDMVLWARVFEGIQGPLRCRGTNLKDQIELRNWGPVPRPTIVAKWYVDRKPF